MADHITNQLAELVIERHTDFEIALFERRRRRYPLREFESFAAALRDYLKAVNRDRMIHLNVMRAVHKFRDALDEAGKKAPDKVMLEAERLECLLFLGYDPSFEGDEPSSL